METSLTYEERIVNAILSERDLKKYLDFLKWCDTPILKWEDQRVKKTSSRKHLNLIASLSIRFKFSDLHGEDVIALTNSQVDSLVESYEEKKGMTIRMPKNAISPQHENRRRIFTSVSRIDSIPNWNYFIRFRRLGFIRIGEYRCSKTNWKRFLSYKSEVVCVGSKLMEKGCILAQQAEKDLKL